MGKLIALAERCEKATGPDRALDGLIFARLNPNKPIIIGAHPGRFPQKPIYGTPLDMLKMLEEKNGKDAADYLGAPPVTASLDAAMTLVPDGMHGQVQFGNRPGAWVGYEGTDAPDFNVARTPALALCAAALRARTQNTPDSERNG